MSRRPLFTPMRAVCGLVLLAGLVVGGLVWVSVTALGVEAAERLSVVRADVSNRERLALWRLDSHMLSPLGVENNRPFNNYSTVAPPALLVFDDQGFPKSDPGYVASPLLSADLPDWALLHFQLDSTAGWNSPQVLPPALVANLQGEPLALPLTNCTQVRVGLLDELRRRLPVEKAIRTLAELDRNDPDVVPYIVLVPLSDEPATHKPTATYPPDDPLILPAPAAELAQMDANVASLPSSSARGYVCDFATTRGGGRRGATGEPPAKRDEATAKEAEAFTNLNPANGGLLSQASPGLNGTGNGPTYPQKLNDQSNSSESKARKESLDRVLSGRGGAYEPQFGGARGGQQQAMNPGGMPGGGGPIGGAGGGGPAGPGGPLPADKDNFKKQVGPGGAGGGGGFGGGGRGGPPSQPTPPAPSQQPQLPAVSAPGSQAGSSGSPPAVVDPQKAIEDNIRNTIEYAEKQSRVIQNRSKQEVEKSLREAGEELAKNKDTKGGRGDTKSLETQKGEKLEAKGDAAPKSVSSAWCAAVCKPADEVSETAAETKTPPIVAPVTVKFGALRPRRLTADDGTEYLFLVRTAVTDSRIIYQGVLVDWAKLRTTLTALVTDLFPTATLVSLNDADGDDAPPERTMTTLPVRLDTGVELVCGDCGWTPLRFGLVIAWAAAVLAIVAVAIGGRAVLAMSDRRVRFASAVTHELRTPLTALQLHLDLLTSGLITDEAKKAEYLTTIAAEADRLNRLVENVLDFARLEKQSAGANARRVCASDLLATIDRTWADRLRSEGFDLMTDSPDPDDLCVFADPRVLEQVLGNLIDNARKYAKAATDRRIWVRVLPAENGKVGIEVEDRGPGVPSNERRQIFKPFIRGSGATDTGGAGLGLSLAKEWADLFGGSLTYHSATDGGACFRLELPRG